MCNQSLRALSERCSFCTGLLCLLCSLVCYVPLAVVTFLAHFVSTGARRRSRLSVCLVTSSSPSRDTDSPKRWGGIKSRLSRPSTMPSAQQQDKEMTPGKGNARSGSITRRPICQTWTSTESSSPSSRSSYENRSLPSHCSTDGGAGRHRRDRRPNIVTREPPPPNAAPAKSAAAMAAPVGYWPARTTAPPPDPARRPVR